MDKVNMPYQYQGHRVKVKVTKVISVFWLIFHHFWNLSYTLQTDINKVLVKVTGKALHVMCC